ncbi:glycosyltransferase [Streptococcus pneumoniae]|uniref:glycosyltransferase n=1 Tax=Streptococcus pneumoniae TaxID=1313 RepID=UPI0005E66ACF|nr:glycosyltransferase [Streptococcus pneumoniae]CEW90816.1 glycosyl transferase family protein [Streptococcus pneumoniae]CEX43082.1 glycosyl transferase family protein [Streptococcus pneumoniae]CGE65663.1 glycosyl transferase family protein [Streptococcus pneumoniae]CGF51227.1 glycosyl transferase family protein [Streptococcus pneumoniae]CIN87967.1 glycosyl transferase family protein [Streptococcus pneumoniae]
MDDKITVIVPVYNVENYLRKCLDSIITQTYKNIEIVVVNDGSTDASGEICKEFAEMDHRITYIEQENAGLSAARNTGLNNMSGNYVTFVDSDDWIELDYVETLYKKITEYQADIAVGNYYSFNESEGMFYFHISGDSYYEKVYDNVSIFENLYETQEMRSFALISAWGKLYKARLFEQLRFDIGKLGEDGYLNQKVYLLSEKVIYLNKSLYAYRIRKGSLSNGQASGLSDTATYKEFEMKQRLLNQLLRQESSEKKAIVLAANYAYVDQVLTTIRSICYHNRSLRFYLIHSDFPNEWIKQLNKRLEKFDSEIINCRVTSEQISCYKSDISYTVFLRYFIADFVQEDKALYLDCDLVVTKNLDDLFATDLQDYPLAVVRDFGGRAYFGQEIFNAGVLLVNNAFWKKENMTQKLIDLTNEWHDKVDQADQSILNMLFEHKWLELDFDYNHIVIHKQFADYQLPEGQDYPAIIHYLSHRKPWKDLAAQTYREVWWYYHGLEWTELGQNHHLHPLQRSHIYPIKEPFTCLIYTASDHIEQIETLVQSLPDIQFKIAARVIVSDRLAQMTIYPNVTIFNGIHYLVDVDNELVETSQVLLDINHGEKTEEILDQFANLGKPILSFENTKTYEVGQEAYAVDQVQAMIEKLREISK